MPPSRAALPGIIESPGLWAALRIQLNVIGALMMRDMHTRFGKRNIGYLWLFVEPMILAGSVGVIHLIIGKGVPGGVPIFVFYILGYSPYYLYRAALNRAADGFVENVSLLYHRRVKLHDVMLARTLLDLCSVLVAMFVFLCFYGAASGNWPQSWVQMAVGTAALSLLCHGVALCILAMTVWGHENVLRVVHPFTYLTLPLSGAFFMLWWFPSDIQWWASLFPTVHAFEIVREGYFGDRVPALYDLHYMLVWTLGANVAGLLALRAAAPHFEQH